MFAAGNLQFVNRADISQAAVTVHSAIREWLVATCFQLRMPWFPVMVG